MSKRAVMPLTDYENACEKIREKTGTTDLIKSGDLPEKIDDVFEKGKQSNYDFLWDTLQENGNRTSYQYAFARSWTDDIYNPKYPIICNGANVYTAEALFSNSKITDTKVPIIITGTRMDAPFQDCINLKRIPSLTLENITRFTANTFRNCRALEELNVYGTIDIDGLNLSYSPLLTKASLLTVINALKDFSENVTINKTLTNNLTALDIISDTYAIEEGKEYTWSYYCTECTGWLSNDATAQPTTEEILITSVAEKINVNGNIYVGFKAETKYWVEDRIATVYVYQDGSEIKVLRDWSNGNDIFDIINLTVTTPVTEKYTVTLGEANLNKLTEEEKAIAINKGWQLQ